MVLSAVIYKRFNDGTCATYTHNVVKIIVGFNHSKYPASNIYFLAYLRSLDYARKDIFA